MTDFTAWRNDLTGERVYRDMEDAAAFHWRMDEGSGGTITDEVQGEVGTINGATWVEGNWPGGWGLEFTAGDYVSFDLDSTAFGGEESMWVSAAFQTADPTARGVLASVVDPDDADRWNLESGSYRDDGSVYWYMAGEDNPISESGILTADTQTHALGIHDDTENLREIMVDGVSQDTDPTNGTVSGGEPTKFKIGRRGAGDREFVGIIGEVMIGFTSLTDYEKGLLYDRQPFSS